MNNDWRHGYSEYDDGTRRVRHTDAPGRYEASDAGDQAYAQTPYSRRAVTMAYSADTVAQVIIGMKIMMI